jgi:hypothetical protein
LPAVRSLLLQGPQASDAAMARIANLQDLEELMIVTKYYSEGNALRALRPPVTDQGISRLSNLRKLKSIYIDDPSLTDESLAAIGTMTQLESIVLQGPSCSFTDAGLARLERLVHLRKLIFALGYGCNEFTDDGLARLKPLAALQDVWLRGGEITDRGLEHLAALPRLTQVKIASSSVSPEAVARFEAAVPGATCKVSPYASFQQETRKIVALLLRRDIALVEPTSVLSELGFGGQRRARLLATLRKLYFAQDADEADRFKALAERVNADETLTVSQLSDLIQQAVAR